MTDLILETGKVQTRDGREVRIYATDAGGAFPVHGARICDIGWEPETWTPKGAYTISDADHVYDLTPIPQPQYFNVYTGSDGNNYTGYMCSSIAGAKEQAVKCVSNTIKLNGTYKYLNGEITKVEQEGGE